MGAAVAVSANKDMITQPRLVARDLTIADARRGFYFGG